MTGVIDLFSRQVVGWSMRDNMQTSAVTDALRMAWFRCHPKPDLGFCHNAPAESLWGRLYGRKFATRREAMFEVMDWLNFYNHKRLHSTLGYVSPMTFEKRWEAAQQQDKKSA